MAAIWAVMGASLADTMTAPTIYLSLTNDLHSWAVANKVALITLCRYEDE